MSDSSALHKDDDIDRYEETQSLLHTVLSKDSPWKKRMWAVIASIGIHLGLPFINGMMLGLGEITARRWIAPFLGIGVYTQRHSNKRNS